MTQFIRNGPNVPENLLRAHEEGRVVFFCGAGISRRAKLPLFKGLVEYVGNKTDNFDKSRTSDFARGNYEVVLNKIERDIGRHPMRRHIWDCLEPSYRNKNVKHNWKNAKFFHESLLALSETKKGRTQLVTTNVDRIFEDCLEDKHTRPKALVAPRPPIPKEKYWDGIVYLHGLLPASNYSNSNTQDNLIFTTADFGRAYLSERWAARFVTEMLKNYTVCFVGYSANDPVMRYLLDAMAEDERDGVKLPKRYIFTNEKHGWKERGVIPILYQKSAHHLLLDTFVAWARDYSLGISAKKSRVNNVLSFSPPRVEVDNTLTIVLSNDKSNFRKQYGYDQIMWALCDPDMVGYFARLDPRPKWEWIDLLSSKEFDHEDLDLFGTDVLFKEKPKNYSKFSLIERKTKFEKTPPETIFEAPLWSNHNPATALDHFCHWVSRHLDSPEVALWLSENGTILGQGMKWAIRNQLEKDNRKPDFPEEERNENDDPVISSVMRRIWGLFLTDTIMPKHGHYDSRWFEWKEQYKLEGGLTPNLKLKLREFLQPKVSIQRPLSTSSIFGGEIKRPKPEDAKSISGILYTEVDIDLYDSGKELADLPCEETTSLDDKQFYFTLFEESLITLFDLYNDTHDSDAIMIFELDNLDKEFNRGWRCIASGLYDLLIDLLDQNLESFQETVRQWIDSEYIYFRRMAIKAFADTDFFTLDYIAEVLTKNSGQILFDHAIYSEVGGLLSKQIKQFSKKQVNDLQKTILANSDEEEQRYKIVYTLGIQQSGFALLPEAKSYLQQARKISEFQWLFVNRQQEPEKFPSLDSPKEEWVEFLVENPNNEEYDFPEKGGFGRNKFDFWLEYCKNKPDEALSCLKVASDGKGEWPALRWNEAFHQWVQLVKEGRQDQDLPRIDGGEILCYLNNLEGKKFKTIEQSATWYIEAVLTDLVGKGTDKGYDATIISFVRKIIELSEKPNQYRDLMMTAINSSIGRATGLAIRFQFIKCPESADGLYPTIRPILDEILDMNEPLIQVIMARRAINFYLWDRKWTEQKMIPLFLSDDEQTYNAMWEGYLYDARWTPDFIGAVKDGLLRLSIKQSDGSIVSENHSSLLMNLYVQGRGVLIEEELQQLIAHTQSEYLPRFLWVLGRQIKASENKGAFFDTVCKPFFQNIWPQGTARRQSPRMSRYYLEIILNSDEKFLEAVDLLKDRLIFDRQYRIHSEYVLRLLGKDKSNTKESEEHDSEDKKGYNYLERFPESVLDLLNGMDLEESSLSSTSIQTLQDCLRAFKERGFENDSRYTNLDDIVQRHTH